jgi:hypothetical protein
MQYANVGDVLWSSYLFQATNMHTPINAGGLATDPSGANTYAYSCLIMTGSIVQTLLKKYEIATGALQAIVEMKSLNAVGC